MRGLVLSLFPGLDLLGRSFESAGWCVVRGPDLVWGHDVRGWHVPQGRFDGVIGGPPCQTFSALANILRAKGQEPRHGNLIPEFERIVSEALPTWWLMENVVRAPIPEVAGYTDESFFLSPRDLGDSQDRVRRYSFGHCLAPYRANIRNRLPFVALESIDFEPTVTSKGPGAYQTPSKLAETGYSWAVAERSSEVQGFPGLSEVLRKDGAFTTRAVCQMLGNGVSRVVGEALAQAINEWLDEQQIAA